MAVESLVVVVWKGRVGQGEGEGEGEGEDLDPGIPFHAGVHWWHARSGCCPAVSMRVATRSRTGEGGGRSNRGRGGGTGGHTISIQHHQPMRCRHSSRAPWHNLRCLASPPCVRARPCAEGPISSQPGFWPSENWLSHSSWFSNSPSLSLYKRASKACVLGSAVQEVTLHLPFRSFNPKPPSVTLLFLLNLEWKADRPFRLAISIRFPDLMVFLWRQDRILSRVWILG